MTAVVAPDNRCERCGGRAVLTEWDDDIRQYVNRCQACGRVQGSVPAIREETEMDGNKEPEKQYKHWSPKAKATEASAAAKPDSAAAKALESYHVATSRYLEASEQLRVDEQRAADAQARAKATAERLGSFKTTMAEARAKLDQELSLLTAAGEPKPFGQRVKVRASKAGPAPCRICGKPFELARGNALYCSDECRAESMRKWHREHPNGQGGVVVEAPPELAEAALA